MTKRFFFQALIGILLLTVNAAKDIIPLGKMHLKTKACELNINQLLKHKPLLDIEQLLSEDELDEIQKLKANYCESISKTIK